ncbi:MAG: hypothetical protein ACOYD4_06650 [Solirubrobacterales bacterium]
MAAWALSGDPAIVSLGPTNGAAFTLNEDGVVHVTFKCPEYHKEEPVEDETEAKEREEKEREEGKKPKPWDAGLGNAGDYIVHFSTSPDTGAGGLLKITGFDEFTGEGLPDEEKDAKGTCAVDFEPPEGSGPAALYHGTVYWQVAREVNCLACGSAESSEANPNTKSVRCGPSPCSRRSKNRRWKPRNTSTPGT